MRYVDLVVLLSLSVVGFGVLLSIGIASVSFGQQFLNYKSNTIGVQIDYPDKWVLEIVFFIPSNESKLDKVVTEQEVLFIIAQDTLSTRISLWNHTYNTLRED
jgi:hypothetical protein